MSFSLRKSSRGDAVRSSIQEKIAVPGEVVRVHQITQIDQLFLVCDNCGADMGQGKLKGFDVTDPSAKTWFEYECPNCGHIHKSTRNYPCQRYHFNLDEFVMTRDDGQVE